MTHRQITPIPLHGIEPGGTPRALPIFEWVDPGTLLIDEGYQRDSSERSLKLVRKVIAGWDWARYKPPVAVLTDAGLELIDGQHTAIAAVSHPGVDKIPVMIVDVKERADRAGAFIGHNRDRVAVTAPQLHVAAVAAGDPDAQTIDRICTGAGVTVLRRQPGTFKPRTTMAVTALRALVRRGEDNATKVMKCLARSELAPITQTQIKAADMLLNDPEYADQISEDALVSAIAATIGKVDQEAAVFCAAHPSTPVWKAVGIAWFKARRAKRGGDQTPTASPPQPVKSDTSGEKRVMTASPHGDLKSASGKLLEGVTGPPRLIPRAAAPTVDKTDKRPKLDGWIPGVFARFCAECQESYIGDKRSLKCADCAYGAAEAVRA